MVFIFQFVNEVYYIDLRILKNPCIPGIKPTWLWCMIFLMCCWILSARILLRIFASMFISDIGLWFSFFVASLSGFGIRVMVSSQNEFDSLPFYATFWKSLSRIGVSSSLNFWQNSSVKPSGPGILFLGRFLITVSIFVLVIGLLSFSLSSWFSFGKLCFSKNSFSQKFILFYGLILFIFSKNQLLVLLSFATVSFISFSFISALIFVISFLQLTLGFFISSFSSCFMCKVRLFI